MVADTKRNFKRTEWSQIESKLKQTVMGNFVLFAESSEDYKKLDPP